MQMEEVEKGGDMVKRCFVFAALWLIFAGSALAQGWSAPKLTTDVPFDFVVNGTTLPAGTYVVRTYMGTERALMIQNRNKPGYVQFVSNNDILLPLGATHDSTGFVFALDKAQHVLHQIYLEGDNHTHDIIHGTDVAELVQPQGYSNVHFPVPRIK
jgi:hypothetical protein